jgi:transcriptional regulator with XRE-family HTH domain
MNNSTSATIAGCYATGAVIRRLRLERGFTQAKLAEYAGLSDGMAVGRIENGTQLDELLERLERTAKALGSTVPQVLEMAREGGQ